MPEYEEHPFGSRKTIEVPDPLYVNSHYNIYFDCEAKNLDHYLGAVEVRDMMRRYFFLTNILGDLEYEKAKIGSVLRHLFQENFTEDWVRNANEFVDKYLENNKNGGKENENID